MDELGELTNHPNMMVYLEQEILQQKAMMFANEENATSSESQRAKHTHMDSSEDAVNNHDGDEDDDDDDGDAFVDTGIDENAKICEEGPEELPATKIVPNFWQNCAICTSEACSSADEPVQSASKFHLIPMQEGVNDPEHMIETIRAQFDITGCMELSRVFIVRNENTWKRYLEEYERTFMAKYFERQDSMELNVIHGCDCLACTKRWVGADREALMNTALLFHKSRSLVPVLQEGFDLRLSRTNGHYGAGIYLSDTPLKCHPYAQNAQRVFGSSASERYQSLSYYDRQRMEKISGDKCCWSDSQLSFDEGEHALLICSVILGESKFYPNGKNDPTLKREPKFSCGRRCDSICGNMTGQTEFVVYNDARVLPSYLVTYRVSDQEKLASKLPKPPQAQPLATATARIVPPPNAASTILSILAQHQTRVVSLSSAPSSLVPNAQMMNLQPRMLPQKRKQASALSKTNGKRTKRDSEETKEEVALKQLFKEIKRGAPPTRLSFHERMNLFKEQIENMFDSRHECDVEKTKRSLHAFKDYFCSQTRTVLYDLFQDQTSPSGGGGGGGCFFSTTTASIDTLCMSMSAQTFYKNTVYFEALTIVGRYIAAARRHYGASATQESSDAFNYITNVLPVMIARILYAQLVSPFMGLGDDVFDPLLDAGPSATLAIPTEVDGYFHGIDLVPIYKAMATTKEVYCFLVIRMFSTRHPAFLRMPRVNETHLRFHKGACVPFKWKNPVHAPCTSYVPLPGIISGARRPKARSFCPNRKICVDQCELDVYDPFWWVPFLCDETTYARELDKKDLEAKRIALRTSGDEMRCPISLDDMLDESVDSSTYGGVLQMRCCGGFVSGDGFKELIQSNKPDGMPCIVKRMYHVTHDRPLDLVWISCPLCRAIHGVRMGLVLYSDEPDSHMYISLLSNVELEGANGQAMCEDTWQIDYNVGACHGKYDGVRRTAYLPDTEEGRTCLSRLILAWRRSLVFRVGHSATLGKDKQLVWNIHHKTNLRGGPTNYGYPDATYLTRLNEELDQLGVFLDPARYIPRYTI